MTPQLSLDTGLIQLQSSCMQSSADLLCPANVAELLKAVAPELRSVRTLDVVVERCWPKKDGGLAFEWSFAHPESVRQRIYGETTPEPAHGHADGFLRLHTPDRDARLRSLHEALNLDCMARRLAPYIERLDRRSPAPSATLSCQLVGYRAGRRAAIVYRWSGADCRPRLLVGKITRRPPPDGFDDCLCAINQQIGRASGRRVRVSLPIGRLDDLHMTLADWVPGRAFADAGPALVEDARRAIDVLASLHQTRVFGLRRFTLTDDAAVVARWQGLLSRLCPLEAELYAALCERLMSRAARLNPADLVPTHRDFHERQLVFGRRSLTVLDWDTLAMADRGVDLATFFAHLLMRFTASGCAMRDFNLLADELLQRYERGAANVDRTNLAYYLASALIRVAAIHSVRTRTRTRILTPCLWAFASAILGVPDSARHGFDDALERDSNADYPKWLRPIRTVRVSGVYSPKRRPDPGGNELASLASISEVTT